MAAGVLNEAPKTNKEWAQVLVNMKDQGRRFGFQLDWEGSCYNCYQTKLIGITKKSSYEDAKAAAEKEDTKLAGEFALKAKHGRDFPDAPGGGKKDFFECRDCHKEVRARGKISRYFKLGA
jgi:hypothetical protein